MPEAGAWSFPPKQLRILGARSEVTAYIAEGPRKAPPRVLRLGVADCLVDPFDTSRKPGCRAFFAAHGPRGQGGAYAGGGGYA